MDESLKLFDILSENEINNYEIGYSIIDQHKQANKGKLKSNLNYLKL